MGAITIQFVAQLPRQKEMAVVPQWLPRPLNISRADLKDKWLVGTNLRFANAMYANLQGADLQGADLLLANFQGANLQGADLRGTNLQEVKSLTKEQIQVAHTDENTKLPPYLTTPGPAKPGGAAPPQAGTPPIE
jgi:hypothetical protein